MNRDDIPLLEALPLVILRDGKRARVKGQKMDNNFWRVEILDNKFQDEENPRDQVLHISEFVSVIPEPPKSDYDHLDGNGRPRRGY